MGGGIPPTKTDFVAADLADFERRVMARLVETTALPLALMRPLPDPGFSPMQASSPPDIGLTAAELRRFLRTMGEVERRFVIDHGIAIRCSPAGGKTEFI